MMTKPRQSLAKKMAISFFAMSTVVLLGSLIFLYGNTSRSAVEMNHTLNEKNLLATQRNISALLDAAELAATSVFYEDTVKLGLLTNEANLSDLSVYNSVILSLHRATLTAPDIGYIAVFKKDGSSASNAVPLRQPFSDYESCLTYFGTKGISPEQIETSSIWYTPEPLPNTYLPEYSFVNLRSLRLLQTQRPNGLMLTYVRESAVYDLYSFFGAESFIIGHDGTVISAGDKTLIGSPAPPSKHYAFLPDGQIWTAESATSVYLPELNAHLIAIPDYTVLSSTQHSTLISLFILAALSLLFSLLSSMFLSSRLTYSVRNLKMVMERAQRGELNIRYTGLGSDEIAFLGASFNTLMDDIERYIERIRLSEQRKRENDIRLLQSQINPHLLYNTLDSALYFVENNDMETARLIIETMSDFFKLSLSKGAVTVPLRTELQHISRYMQLQRLCRGKEISLQVSCEESLLDIPILKTTLQPIVENTYLHAYEGVWSEGTINLTVAQKGPILELRLADDGMGMDESTLHKLQSELEADAPNTGGFGLWNIHQRLRTYYGPSYGVSIESEFGYGTTVYIYIPYDQGGGEHHV